MAEEAKTAEVVKALPIDQDFGREVKQLDRALDRQIFTTRIKDRWSSLARALKPADIAAALRAAEEGDLTAQNDLFERMEEMDGALSGFAATRRLAPSGLRYSIVPKDSSEDAKKAADLCRKVVEDIPDFRGALIDLSDAIGKGISILEIDWVNSPDQTWVRGLRHINAKRYVYDKRRDAIRIRVEDEGKTIVPSIFGDSNQFFDDAEGILPPAFKVIAHRSKTRSGHPGRAGFMRVVTTHFLIRNYAWKDWSTYGEIFGMPLRLGKYPAGASDTDKAALLAAVRALGSDAAAIISEQTMIEFVDSVERGVQPYEALGNAMRTEMALAILGQELTNLTAANGARALGQVQQLVRQDLLETDCEQLMETIARDLFIPIIGFNLGWDIAREFRPIFKLHYEPPADLKTLIEIDRVLFAPKAKGGLALPFTKKQLYSRYGIEPPPEDAKPEEFLVLESDEQMQASDEYRFRPQKGQNNDSRSPEERAMMRQRQNAGSNAAKFEVVKAFVGDRLSEKEIEAFIELLTGPE